MTEEFIHELGEMGRGKSYETYDDGEPYIYPDEDAYDWGNGEDYISSLEEHDYDEYGELACNILYFWDNHAFEAWHLWSAWPLVRDEVRILEDPFKGNPGDSNMAS